MSDHSLDILGALNRVLRPLGVKDHGEEEELSEVTVWNHSRFFFDGFRLGTITFLKRKVTKP